jgi:DNA-binding Xre family transcriptional regulator
MEDSGVKSIQEMANRLKSNQGYEISRTPLSRKVNDEDITLTLSLIEAICNELQCLPGDLFGTEITDATEEYVNSLRSRLQPFRYGSIRLARSGADEPASANDQSRQVPPSAVNAASQSGQGPGHAGKAAVLLAPKEM